MKRSAASSMYKSEFIFAPPKISRTGPVLSFLHFHFRPCISKLRKTQLISLRNELAAKPTANYPSRRHNDLSELSTDAPKAAIPAPRPGKNTVRDSPRPSPSQQTY